MWCLGLLPILLKLLYIYVPPHTHITEGCNASIPSSILCTGNLFVLCADPSPVSQSIQQYVLQFLHLDLNCSAFTNIHSSPFSSQQEDGMTCFTFLTAVRDNSGLMLHRVITCPTIMCRDAYIIDMCIYSVFACAH